MILAELAGIGVFATGKKNCMFATEAGLPNRASGTIR